MEQYVKIQDVTLLRQFMENAEIPEPLLFKSVHREWEPCLWSLDMWEKILVQNKDPKGLNCRVGQKVYTDKEPQWEAKSRHSDIPWEKLISWSDQKYWAYYDYKDVIDAVDQKYLKKFEWSRLGFPEKDGKFCNLWLGTEGCCTPCHFDSYGCNVITQVHGRKTWLLFPPSDSEHLHPTRIPYEESSVWSKINFCSPHPSHYDDLKKCKPLKVLLEPGDVLFVPPKWWHFVKSEQFSISINMWIDQEEDDYTRFQEAAVRYIFGAAVSLATPDSTVDILNPNEEELTEATETYLAYLLSRSYEAYEKSKQLKKALKATDKAHDFRSNGHDHASNSAATKNEDDEPEMKKRKTTTLSDFLALHPFIKKLSPYTFEFPELATPEAIVPKKVVSGKRLYNHLLNAITNPRILNLICEEVFKNAEADTSQ